MNGIAASGYSDKYSREDHTHPTDTSIAAGLNGKVAKAGDTMSGDLTIYRANAPTTGYIFYGNTGQKYFGYDGANLIASANITVAQINGDNHQSTGPNLILGGAGGNVYLRPNGVGSGSGEAYFRNDGYLIVSNVSIGNYLATGGAIAASGTVSSGRGYQTKAGYSAGLGSNWFNIQWASNGGHLWIDDLDQGQIWSDARMPRAFGLAGYHQFCPGGMMIQWGTNVVTLDGAGLAPIVYPTSFPNATMAFIPTNGDSSNGPEILLSLYKGSGYPFTYQAAVYGRSTLTGLSAVNRVMRVDWIAFGY